MNPVKSWVCKHRPPCTTSNHMQNCVYASVCIFLQEVPLFPLESQRDPYPQRACCSLTYRIRKHGAVFCPPWCGGEGWGREWRQGRLQVWVLLTNKHHCSALWKQINHQDLKKLSPRNALVLDSKHIFFHQVNISRKCSQALSVREKEKKLGARLKK